MDQQRLGPDMSQHSAAGSQAPSQAGSQINLPAASGSQLHLRSSTQVTLVEDGTAPADSYNYKTAKTNLSTSTIPDGKEEQYHIPEDLTRHTSPTISQVRRTSQDTEDLSTEWSFATQLEVSFCMLT